MLYSLGSTIAFLTDSFMKEKVEKTVKDDEKKQVCKGKIQIEKYHNKGAVLNALENRPGMIKIIHTVVLVWTVVYTKIQVKKHGNAGNKMGRSLLLAGGLNNLCDRYRRGYVVDYLRFSTPWKWLNRLVFNLSDFFVFAGALLMLLFSKKEEP